MRKVQWLVTWACAGVTNADLERWLHIEDILTDDTGRQHLYEFANSRKFKMETLAIKLFEKHYPALEKEGPVAEDLAMDLEKDAENVHLALPGAVLAKVKDFVAQGETKSGIGLFTEHLKEMLKHVHEKFNKYAKEKNQPPTNDN